MEIYQEEIKRTQFNFLSFLQDMFCRQCSKYTLFSTIEQYCYARISSPIEIEIEIDTHNCLQ